MRLSKHQKIIIQKIASGEVYDITSFLKAFNLSTLRKLDKEVVENKVRTAENGATYKKLKDGINRFTNTTVNILGMDASIPAPRVFKNEDFIDVEAVVDYSKCKISTTTIEGTKYYFDYSKGINITNSFSDIKEFLTIWQFLKSEGLVLEVDKQIQKEDYEVFIEYKPINETSYGQRKSSGLPSVTIDEITLTPIENQPIFSGDDPNRFKDFRDYIDFFCEYNKESEIICSSFIGKQIYGNPELDLFIKRNYHTKEQINIFHSLIPAYLALILTLGITIWQEIHKDNSDLLMIQNQLSAIQAQLEENTSSTENFENIEELLESILNEKYNDNQIIEKLDKVIEEIQDIKKSQD